MKNVTLVSIFSSDSMAYAGSAGITVLSIAKSIAIYLRFVSPY